VQRLALFDLDNTLIDLDAAFGLWAEEFAEEHSLEREDVDWLINLDRDGFPHRELFFGAVRERFHLRDSVEVLWGAYRKRMPYLVECRPEVLAGLAQLRRAGWRVGIITNGMADNQLGKIQRTGLADVVDGYALSGAEGIRKPNVALFEIAARRCGVSMAEGGWMVGDHLVKDIAGGRAAGLRTVWINRNAGPKQEHEADHMVTNVMAGMAIISGGQ
jgi:putative hydrolase of the HAD superfamily